MNELRERAYLHLITLLLLKEDTSEFIEIIRMAGKLACLDNGMPYEIAEIVGDSVQPLIVADINEQRERLRKIFASVSAVLGAKRCNREDCISCELADWAADKPIATDPKDATTN